MAGLLVILLAGGLLCWRPWQTSSPSSGVVEQRPDSVAGVEPAAQAMPLEGLLDVVVYESAQDDINQFVPAARRQRLRLHQRQALPLQPRDWIRIEATVNREAYLYLVWIGSDGVATPLWPWVSPNPERPADWTDPRAQEKPRKHLTLPGDVKPGATGMPLTDEPRGIVTLLLLARERPLTKEDSVDLARILAPQKRNPVGECMLAVWLENGAREIDRFPIVGKGASVGDVEEQVCGVMRRIHARFGYVRAVYFGNQGQGNP
jgi:hypothetical protein